MNVRQLVCAGAVSLFAAAAGGCASEGGAENEVEVVEQTDEATGLQTLRLDMTPLLIGTDFKATDKAHKIYIHGIRDAQSVRIIVGNFTAGGNSRTYDAEAAISGACNGGFGDTLPLVSSPLHDANFGPGQSMTTTAGCEISFRELSATVFFTQL